MNKADFDYCKDEFLWFLNVQYGDLKGKIKEQIDEFCHNFCFDDLYNYESINKLFLNVEDKKRYIELSYGSNSKDALDCDDTHLARIVYFLIHRDEENNEYALPNLINFSDIGSGYKYKYRGDTINTYSTLFGSKNQGYEIFFKLCNVEDEGVANFRNRYVTMGNFILLPATTVQLNPDTRKWYSMNSYRGTNERYRDYFDLFISRLMSNDCIDFKLWKEQEELKDYFNFMNDKCKFIKANILENYFNMETHQAIPNLFKHKDKEAPYYWYMDNKIDDIQYRQFALRYIDKATEIIRNRACKISNILKSLYN